MRIGKKCTLYNNEFLLRIQFYKKKHYSLINRHDEGTLEGAVLVRTHYSVIKCSFKFAIESNAHANFRDVIWPKKVRITFE
jgi:hypothetical protein